MQTCCKEGNLLRMQPVAVHQRAKALAAQTKPARAGVRCRASAELHLTANAGRCELNSWARMRTAACALASGDAECCANEALQGWCAAHGSEERQMQLQPFCIEGNLLRMQPVALHQRAKALAAQTKPARAGVWCRASAELHLTATAGRCDCGTAGRGCGLLEVLWRLVMRQCGDVQTKPFRAGVRHLAVKSGKCSCRLTA